MVGPCIKEHMLCGDLERCLSSHQSDWSTKGQEELFDKSGLRGCGIDLP